MGFEKIVYVFDLVNRDPVIFVFSLVGVVVCLVCTIRTFLQLRDLEDSHAEKEEKKADCDSWAGRDPWDV